MSGNGGSSFPNDGRGGSSADGINICSTLFEKTILNSPVPEVIARLKQDDHLQICLHNEDRIVVALHNGDIAGSITSPKLIDFIECIKEGNNYIATVDKLNGGQCHVTVRPEVMK